MLLERGTYDPSRDGENGNSDELGEDGDNPAPTLVLVCQGELPKEIQQD